MNRERTIQRRLFKVVAAIAASGLLLLASCSNPVDSAETADCGPGVIIPGVCIDGVKLGDSLEQVVEMLGEPSGIGWTDGIHRGWRSYHYKPPEAEGSGLLIRFIYQGEDELEGPVDFFNVYELYEGKTPDGIGVGSTLEKVRNAYGEPDDIPSDVVVDGTHRLQYTYCFDSIKFTIGMHDQIVIGFFMGFFIPIEQGQTFQCK